MEISDTSPPSDPRHRAGLSDTVDLREVLAKFWARKWLIMASIIVCGGLAFSLAKVSTPVYTSDAFVMIKTRQTSAPNDPRVETMMEGGPETAPTEAFVLRSRILARETIGRLQLDRDPEFNPLLRKPNPLLAPFDPLPTLFAPAMAPHGEVRHAAVSAAAGEPSTIVIDEFLKRLSVAVEGSAGTQERSNVIRVSFSSARPATAARVPNTLIALYLEQQASASLVSDAAVPLAPSYPKTKTMVMVGLAIGAGVGIVLAAMLDVLLGGLRSKQQVEEVLGIRCLALVPRLQQPRRNERRARALFLFALASRPKRSRRNRFPVAEPHNANGEPTALRPRNEGFDQALRSVRLKLYGCEACAERRVMLVTSALPEEGRTWVAAGLAASLAGEGLRVALMDCDLHRPAVHRMFNGARGPGLTDFFGGDAAFDEIIHHDTGSGVDYVPVGSALSQATWRITADRLRPIIERLREKYAFVVIDSAPVLAVAETAVLSQIAHKTIFVIRWGATPQAIVRHALIQLSESGGSEIAALLSMVDLKRAARHGDIIAGAYRRLASYYDH